VVEWLPLSATDRNRVEWLWEHRKDKEMAHLTCLDLEDLHVQFYRAHQPCARETSPRKGRCRHRGQGLTVPTARKGQEETSGTGAGNTGRAERWP
jgi:hypothetical protein